MSSIQSRFLARMFRKIEGLAWDISTGKMGLNTKDGIVTLEINTSLPAEGQTAVTQNFAVSVNPFDSFAFAVPAFAQNTPLSQVEVGDLIVGDTKALGWVIERRERSLKLMDQNGMTKDYTPPKVAVLGQDGAMVVKSLTGLLGNEGAAGVQGALLPLLLAGSDSGVDIEGILPMLLLSQQQGGSNANANNTLQTLLLLKGLGGNGGRGGNLESLLLPMMLSGGLGGGAGGIAQLLPLLAMSGGLGGGSAAPTQAVAVPPLSAGRSFAPPLQRLR